MAARALWKGQLRFSEHTLPVKMYSMVEDRKVHFHLLHAKDLTPVHQRIVRKTDGKEVPPEQQMKALPVDADNAVLVRPEELDEAEPKPSRDIDVLRCVPPATIGDAWYDRPYYLGPDDDEPGYFALADAIAHQRVVAIARWVMRKKRYVGALAARDGYLVMLTLRRADQVLSVAGLDIPASRKPDDKEIRLAEQLVEAISADFEPQGWHDEYRERVLKLIEAKARGAKVAVQPPKPVKTTGALADQLQRSLALAREKRVA